MVYAGQVEETSRLESVWERRSKYENPNSCEIMALLSSLECLVMRSKLMRGGRL